MFIIDTQYYNNMELARITEQGVEITYCDPAAMLASAENAKNEYDNAVASGIQEGIDILIKRSETLAEMAEAEQDRYSALLADNYYEFVSAEKPDNTDDMTAVDSFEVKDGRVYQRWTMTVNKHYYQERIESLKSEIASSDYKLTKCAEASLLGLQLPYDVLLLHNEREAIREQIRECESKLLE